jgi:hypothetical protein
MKEDKRKAKWIKIKAVRAMSRQVVTWARSRRDLRWCRFYRRIKVLYSSGPMSAQTFLDNIDTDSDAISCTNAMQNAS